MKKGFHNSPNAQPKKNTCLAFDSHLNEPLRLSVELESKNMQKQHIMSNHHDLKDETQACACAHTHTHQGEEKKDTCPWFVLAEYPVGGLGTYYIWCPLKESLRVFLLCCEHPPRILLYLSLA